MRQLPLAAVLAALSLHAQTYTLGPDSQPKDGVPHGTVTKYILPQGKLYPGTPHEYSVYLPAQYDARMLPVMVGFHGTGGKGSLLILRLQALAEREGFIVIAPDSVSLAGVWTVGEP